MNKKTLEVTIKTEFITLGQLLKLLKIVSTGGEAKSFLTSYNITVNGIRESRRGRKLYKGNVIEMDGDKILLK